MEEAAYYIRLATPADAARIRQEVRYTLANPEGRGQRKRFEDAIGRGEVLVLERYDAKERALSVQGFVEWHQRLDGMVTIKDAGSVGEGLNVGIVRRLVRELLSLLNPTGVQVKVRADQTAWNELFQGIPGFQIEGQEYTRPHWRNVWSWSPERARAQAKPASAGRRGRRGRR